MNLELLTQFREESIEKYDRFERRISNLPIASADTPTTDEDSDALAEAFFLRIFAGYERDLEKLFLHYVAGGSSLSGRAASGYLRPRDESHARALIKGSARFLNWAKPSTIRDTASNYIENGWPLADIIGAKTADLSDCEKVRNRIAHASPEASSEFAAVQRNLFRTERPFTISPGQLLRTRYRQSKQIVMQHYNKTMKSTIEAIADPPN